MFRFLPGVALAMALTGCGQPATSAPNTRTSASPSTTPSASPLPAKIWVNAPLGVNVRTAPDASSARLTSMPQGAQAPVGARRTATDGSTWYQVKTDDGQLGWVNASYVVTSAIFRASSTADGWTLMLPAGYSTRTVPSPSPSTFTAGPAADNAPPFVKVQVAPTVAALPPATPTGATFDHSRITEVWNYTVQAKIYRTPEGLYLSVVRVPAPNRAYQFLFLTTENDSAVVAQIVASIALN